MVWPIPVRETHNVLQHVKALKMKIFIQKLPLVLFQRMVTVFEVLGGTWPLQSQACPRFRQP